MEELLSLIGKEVIAEGDWRRCKTTGFIGRIKRKDKVARGYCKVKPQPGSKLKLEMLMHQQDRGFCIILQEDGFSATQNIMDNRDAVLEEKMRNDVQDEQIREIQHEIELLKDQLPGGV